MKKYNETLNLPKTDFQMKANLPSREPEIFSKWEKLDLYKKMLEKNRGNKSFILHDGPPYANGEIHLGHAMNKILKDFIVKFKSMSGFFSPFIPGWDTHGLPTELKAKKSIKDYDKLSVSELREACKNIAMHFVDVQRNSFKRLGVFGDWEHPYITFNKEFESKQIQVFAELVKKGAIYRGTKPVYWCSCCKTALAEAEIEYKEDPCKSIFVEFKLKDDLGKFKDLNIDLDKIFFIIWTTTPWTIPANVAICLHPDFEYSLVKTKDKVFILASELVDSCMNLAKISEFSIIKKFKGKDLEGIVAYHPFLDKESLVINGHHVNLESGTGCVHTAPGHGLDDYNCCKGYKLPIDVVVNEYGKMNDNCGEFSGLKASEANEKIVNHLEEIGSIFSKKDIVHKYPHCWRCKKPVLFRATDQWFCSVDSIKKDAISAVDSVKWHPSWGGQSIRSMIQDRSDWCISRQRRWGVPIPVFFCESCNEPLADYDVIMRISEIFKEFGSNIWYDKEASFFLKDECKCKKCGNKNFVKEEDIMDVWFDSGSSHTAVLKESELPADLYLEGSDQYRGWFQSSLLTSVGIGKGAPYKEVLTHGWVLDEQARKQSKSLGNVISPESIITKYGSDILRLWVSSSDYTDNVKISNEILSQISESYRKIRNTARFILGNLYDFNPNEFIKFEDLESMDKFIITRLKKIFDKCIDYYNKFEFYSVFHDIQNFCITDLSNFYLDIIKDRLYVSKPCSHTRRSAQTTIWVILNHIVKILAPILSFTCEEIWSFIPKINDIPSVFLTDMNFEYRVLNDDHIENYWKSVREISDIIKKELERAREEKIIGSSLEADVILKCDCSKVKNVEQFSKDIKDVCMVSGINFENTNSDIKVKVQKSPYNKCARCWMYDKTVGKIDGHEDICSRCVSVLH